MSEPSLFVPHQLGYMPTEYARSPWSLELLHGGPVVALLTRAITERVNDPAFRLTRLTTDLFRPVPYAPMRVETEVLRDGRRVKAVRASLIADATEVTQAHGLMLATRDDAEPGLDVLSRTPPFPAQLDPPEEGRGERSIAYASNVEWRRVTQWGADKPAISWMRVPMNLLPGDPLSPTERAAAVSDFVNPLANMAGGAPYINADITLYLHRPPVGEWLCLQVSGRGSADGIATGEAQLHDQQGPVGRCLAASLAQDRGSFLGTGAARSKS